MEYHQSPRSAPECGETRSAHGLDARFAAKFSHEPVIGEEIVYKIVGVKANRLVAVIDGTQLG